MFILKLLETNLYRVAVPILGGQIILLPTR